MYYEDLLYVIPASLTVITFHEFSHALVSYWLGDPTAKEQHRLSLNPFKHMSIMGIAIFVVMVSAFGVGFGWAKPVPFDLRNFRNPKRDVALVSAAGPLSNFLIAAVVLLLYGALYALPYSKVLEAVIVYLYYTAIISTALGVFNLIPIPPLDGSKILISILPDRAYYTALRYEKYGIILLAALLIFGALDKVLGIVNTFVFDLLSHLATFSFNLFLGL